MSCRDCLLTANGAKFGTDDPTEMFYDSFGQAITNIFVACTEKGASVKVADGTEPGICGWNSFGGWACVGFDQDKGTGWASEVDSSTKEVRLGRAEVVLAGAQVSASASASASATKTGSSSGVVGLATGSSSAEASSTATKASIWINNAESAVPSASSTPIDNTGNNASPDLRSGLGSSMALVAVVVLLVAAF